MVCIIVRTNTLLNLSPSLCLSLSLFPVSSLSQMNIHSNQVSYSAMGFGRRASSKIPNSNRQVRTLLRMLPAATTKSTPVRASALATSGCSVASLAEARALKFFPRPGAWLLSPGTPDGCVDEAAVSLDLGFLGWGVELRVQGMWSHCI